MAQQTATRAAQPAASRMGGALVIAISPTRIILTKEAWRQKPLYRKCPGGGIKEEDREKATEIMRNRLAQGRVISYREALAIAAAIRELLEETGILVHLEKVTLCRHESEKSGKYEPHVCLAELTEAQMDSRAHVTYENNDPARPTRVQAYGLERVLSILDLHPEHRPFLTELVSLWRESYAACV